MRVSSYRPGNGIGSNVAMRGAFPRHSRAVRAGFDCVMECSKPVIAAVNGAAIGAGCVLALVCDIILVADDAFMSMTEVDVGLETLRSGEAREGAARFVAGQGRGGAF